MGKYFNRGTYIYHKKSSPVYWPGPLALPPQNLSKEMEQDLEKMGECYHAHRCQLMIKMELGLTKTYNLFHKKDLSLQDIIKESKKDTPTVETAFQDLLKLRELHKQMDMAVLTAYGWTDIQPAHDFYEVDYLPENDRIASPSPPTPARKSSNGCYY